MKGRCRRTGIRKCRREKGAKALLLCSLFSKRDKLETYTYQFFGESWA